MIKSHLHNSLIHLFSQKEGTLLWNSKYKVLFYTFQFCTNNTSLQLPNQLFDPNHLSNHLEGPTWVDALFLSLWPGSRRELPPASSPATAWLATFRTSSSSCLSILPLLSEIGDYLLVIVYWWLSIGDYLLVIVYWWLSIFFNLKHWRETVQCSQISKIGPLCFGQRSLELRPQGDSLGAWSQE